MKQGATAKIDFAHAWTPYPGLKGEDVPLSFFHFRPYLLLSVPLLSVLRVSGNAGESGGSILDPVVGHLKLLLLWKSPITRKNIPSKFEGIKDAPPVLVYPSLSSSNPHCAKHNQKPIKATRPCADICRLG